MVDGQAHVGIAVFTHMNSSNTILKFGIPYTEHSI
jgi:hypothetical protein